MDKLQILKITDITVNPYQPRQQFDQKDLEELAQSIQQNGVIQPIIVRPSDVFGYELIAGERRLRASKIAGKKSIPAIITSLSDDVSKQQAVVENIQRVNLNPIEEAKAYQNLQKSGLTHEEIARKMGKSRPYITNSLRLLQLDPVYQQAILDKHISPAHGRLFLSLPKMEQKELYQLILKQKLSVRQAEQLLKNWKKDQKNKIKTPQHYTKDLEKQLKQLLGMPINIKHKKNGEGKLIIHFPNSNALQDIINKLK